ncbi:hypothetical protein RJT17_36385 [Streptomyces sp. P5-A9]|uniref:hypothetical protein n=1 Tax=Streptomyces sp. P5-A9 TaxID=3071730 RepID=UPI002FCAFA75
MLAAPKRPDAVHGLHETYGQAMVVAARRLGLTVPDDLMISVMRESDHSAGAADWGVPLTALSLDARRRRRPSCPLPRDQSKSRTSAYSVT